MQINQSRRDFLASASLAAVGAAGLLGARRSLADEAPPETTTIRLIFDPVTPGICFAPQYVAEEFLRAEGFTDVRYVPVAAEAQHAADARCAARSDFRLSSAPTAVVCHRPGACRSPCLSGLHAGCYRAVRATSRSARITRPEGQERRHPDAWAQRRAPVPVDHGRVRRARPRRGHRMGRLPNAERHGAVRPRERSMPSSAFRPSRRSCAPEQIGHVILNTHHRQAMVAVLLLHAGRQPGVRPEHPVATKRVLRAILKAADLCSPSRSAPRDGWSMAGFAALRLRAPDAPRMSPTRLARYDPEDTHALLRAAAARGGMIKHSPNEILAEGTDWRFLERAQARAEGVSHAPALVIALGLLAWPALALAHEAKHEQHEERLPTIGAAPDFALTSQDGARGDARGAARQGRRGDVHLHLLPRRLPDAHRQDGAGAGRAGRGFRQQDRLRLDHRRSGARHARGAERVRGGVRGQPRGLELPHRRAGGGAARWRTATAWPWPRRRTARSTTPC